MDYLFSACTGPDLIGKGFLIYLFTFTAYIIIFFFSCLILFLVLISFFISILQGLSGSKRKLVGGLSGADGQKQKETKHPYFFLYPLSHTKLHSGDIMAFLRLMEGREEPFGHSSISKPLIFLCQPFYKTDDAISSWVSTVYTRSIKVY